MVGCSDGTLLSVPMHPSFHHEAGPQAAIELPKPYPSPSGLVRGMAGGLNRFLSGLVSQTSSSSSGQQGPAPISIFPLGSNLALVVYSDCSIRAFTLPNDPSSSSSSSLDSSRAQKRLSVEVFSDTLSLPPASQSSHQGPLGFSCAFMNEGSGGDHFLVVGFETLEGDLNSNPSHRGGGGNLISRLGLYTLHLTLPSQGAAHASNTATATLHPKVVIRDKKELLGWPHPPTSYPSGPNPPSITAILLSSCCDGASVWCLMRAQGSSHLLSFNRVTGAYEGSTLTLDRTLRVTEGQMGAGEGRVVKGLGRCDLVMMVSG